MISSESERRAAGGAMHGLCRETIVELEGDVWTGRRCIRTIEHAREKVGTPETSRWTVEVERLQALGWDGHGQAAGQQQRQDGGWLGGEAFEGGHQQI